MIVVDSTVWIDFFRGRDTPGTARLLPLIGAGVILVGDIVLAEVLRGFPDERRAERGRRTLELFTVEPMIGRDLAVAAARNCRVSRCQGITIGRAIDLLIGTFCLERDHVLRHADRNFQPMVEHFGLRVA